MQSTKTHLKIFHKCQIKLLVSWLLPSSDYKGFSKTRWTLTLSKKNFSFCCCHIRSQSGDKREKYFIFSLKIWDGVLILPSNKKKERNEMNKKKWIWTMLERIKKRTKNKEKKVSSYYSVSRLVLILRMKKLLCFEKNKNFLPNTSKEKLSVLNIFNSST